jgi:hypothetical protein
MKKLIFLIVLILVIPVYFSNADTTIVYENREKGTTTGIKTSLTKTETGYEEITEKEEIVSSPDFLTEKSIFQEPEKNTKYMAVKVGNEIQVTGTLKGKDVKKVLVLKNKVWLQSFTTAAMYFMTKDFRALTFSIIRQDTIELIDFEITRKKIEAIDIQGASVQTQKLRLNPTGIGSLFWSMDSWLRLSDFIPVYSKMSDGHEIVFISQN